MLRLNEDINYNFAQEKAYEVLLKYSDGTLPIDPFKIIAKIKDIKLMTYTEFAKTLQKKQPELSIEEIKCQFESERGFLKRKGKKYILAYNELDYPTVIKWTLFHELGHYYLEHLNESYNHLFYNGIDYDFIKEKEANCFARHCSCPFPITKKAVEIIAHDVYIPELMRSLFDMGIYATECCSQHFEKYHTFYDNKKYEKLVSKFEKSINEIIDFYEVFNQSLIQEFSY